MSHADLAAEAWAAIGGDPAAATRLTVTGGTGPGGRAAPLPGPLPTGALATATVGAMLLAAADLAAARGAGRPEPALDAGHAAVAFTSERHVLLDGHGAGAPMDPLTAFLPTADGWIRLHANYPHHRAALMRALGHPRAGADGVAALVAGREAVELESAIVAAGGCAAALRDPLGWRRGEPGTAVAQAGLLDVEPGVPRATTTLPALPSGADPSRPLAGLKVLDLTRVIAGPVATRVLAALGAQVLRVDAPLMAELPLPWLDTGPGKRSTHLQLRSRPDRERLHRLLDDADVLVAGYRPGALDPFGLSHDQLEEKHPHLCSVTLSAWGETGPWRARRGFDSLVQAATGIAHVTSLDGGATPGVLPAQALDHGTGYLIAAAAMRALTLRAREGRVSHARVALARTAMWLLAHTPADGLAPDGGAAAAPPAGAVAPPSPAPYLDVLDSPLGQVTVVRPPGTLGGAALGWATGPAVPGSAAPHWD
ncbi:CoA transferase [Paraconexibacter antarcticus]|uniref:CoA transferase n=1 Tax=Paraconexibacter antarcticus TaxID=2949664 RepID=A0ABY5DVU1_9ACTN|nr:CoA transferase [Paraconexibacter antarcticus]UTI64770.1 CoA transferase [Paraconexibacter antarcticus]